MNILLTGGAGYIGSHAAVVFSQAGHEVVLLDNFCNSNPSILGSLQKILGKVLPCIEADVRETNVVEKILRQYKIDAVVHFAGLKAVSESVGNPLLYYGNNVQGTISLLQAMQKVQIKTLVFSSSATVYGAPQYLPYDEDHPTNPLSPYGQSKLQAEEILSDLAASDPEWKIASLRYFNPVGAHESGLIGEDPRGIPNNLMPYIAKVATGELPQLNIFGNDYETLDGTGERDYIHVMDIAEGHMAALIFLKKHTGWNYINLGTGEPTSVTQLLIAFEKVVGKKLKTQIKQRRPGDLPCYYASIKQAQVKLNWSATRSIEVACMDVWKFQKDKNSL